MTCPECKGTGKVELFTSVERCTRCASKGQDSPYGTDWPGTVKFTCPDDFGYIADVGPKHAIPSLVKKWRNQILGKDSNKGDKKYWWEYGAEWKTISDDEEFPEI